MLANEMKPDEIKIPAKKPSNFAPPKEAATKTIDWWSREDGNHQCKSRSQIGTHAHQLSSGQQRYFSLGSQQTCQGSERELAEHIIDVNKGSKPVKQKLWRFAPDRKATIKKEITKLMAVGFIREIINSDWLANPVLVEKKNSKEWRMCIDYTDLNKHCSKDPYVPPSIDQSIDSTAQLCYPF